jgi:hypothetical protein
MLAVGFVGNLLVKPGLQQVHEPQATTPTPPPAPTRKEARR